jgi:hypothetical protein
MSGDGSYQEYLIVVVMEVQVPDLIFDLTILNRCIVVVVVSPKDLDVACEISNGDKISIL